MSSKITSSIAKEIISSDGVKKILQNVDDIILKKKTIKNPSDLLQKKKDIKVGDKDVSVGPSGETTEIGVKDFNVKIPKATPETAEEFIKSFGKTNIPKDYLIDFNINKFTKNEDIIKLINLVSKNLKKEEVVKQTRGVRTNQTTKAAGTKLAKDKDFLVNVLGTKVGQTYNAEQIYAIRQILEAGQSRLNYLANKIVDPLTATGEDALRFRQHYALMAQIQKVLIGVKTETGRALQQFKIISDASKKFSFIGDNIDELKRKELLIELGGFDDIRQIAKLHLSAPMENGARLKAVQGVGLKNWSIKTSDAISEIFINAILSNPFTHVRNFAGNWISQAIRQQERKMAGSYFKGNSSGQGINNINKYEYIAKAYGRTQAAQEIMAAMKNTYKIGGNKIDARFGNISSQNFNIKNKTIGGAVDKVGSVVNIPTQLLSLADDYFKNAELRSELYARAFNEGMEMYDRGFLSKISDVETYIASRIQNPTTEMLDAATAEARKATFQTPLGQRNDVFDIFKAGQTVKRGLSEKGPFSWMANYYFPFIRTPVNLAGFVAERTPVLAQVLTRYNAKIAAGGREAAIAKAQLRLGSYFYLASAGLGYFGVVKGSDLHTEGKLTGGKSLILKTTKNEPFTINIPLGNNKYQRISFRGFDPVAQMLANGGNFGQMLSMMQGSIQNNILAENDPQYLQLSKEMLGYAIAFTFSIGENLSNSTMLTGAGELFDDISSVSSGFYSGGMEVGLKKVKEVGSDFITSFYPAGLKELAKQGWQDEYQRLAVELNDKFKKYIVDGDLEFDYDMRGRKYDKFTYLSIYEKDDIDRELETVFPQVTPVKDYIQYDFGLGTVSVPLKSDEVRFLKKNAGLYFDQQMKNLMNDNDYKNETRRIFKVNAIQKAWENSKQFAKQGLLNENTIFEDENGNKRNFLDGIKTRAEELRDQKILNTQKGYINDNIDNNN